MMKKLALCEKGVSILELSIALPLLLILSYSTLEITLKINSLQQISSAAQEGVKVAASYAPSTAPGTPAVDICPIGREEVSLVCTGGGIENIPADANIGKVARISTCNYLKEQNIDASNFLITTTVEYRSFEGKNFPVIQLSMKERNPSCTVCIEKLVSIIPADTDASMTIQNCVTTVS